jgi:hypothetical protein
VQAPKTQLESCSTILRPSSSKGVARKVKPLEGIVSQPIIILAVNDARLARMKLQTTFSKPLASTSFRFCGL